MELLYEAISLYVILEILCCVCLANELVKFYRTYRKSWASIVIHPGVVIPKTNPFVCTCTPYGYRAMFLCFALVSIIIRALCSFYEWWFFPAYVTYWRSFPELCYYSLFSLLTLYLHQLSSMFYSSAFCYAWLVLLLTNLSLYILFGVSLYFHGIKLFVASFVVIKALTVAYILYSGLLIYYKISLSVAESPQIKNRLLVLLSLSSFSLLLSCAQDGFHFSEHLSFVIYGNEGKMFHSALSALGLDGIMFSFTECLPVLIITLFGFSSNYSNVKNGAIFLFEPLESTKIRSASRLQSSKAVSKESSFVSSFEAPSLPKPTSVLYSNSIGGNRTLNSMPTSHPIVSSEKLNHSLLGSIEMSMKKNSYGSMALPDEESMLMNKDDFP